MTAKAMIAIILKSTTGRQNSQCAKNVWYSNKIVRHFELRFLR